MEQPPKMNSLYFPSRSPFLGLPQEIILMILLDVVEEEGEISWQERTRLQLICRALHDFVNLTPSFWSQISVSEPKETWQQHLAKSGQLELTVTCDCPPHQELHASFLSTILPHAHRICSLTCSVNYESSDEVAEITARAAPIIRDLRIFYKESLMRMDGIPFADMPNLETLDLSGLLIVREPMWWEATGLWVVKLENVNWPYEISTFLDFLEANDQLESFQYNLLDNTFSRDELDPQILPAPYDTIILPDLTHFSVDSIPAFHLLTILQHVSFPSQSHITATVIDSCPPEQPGADFIVPAMNHLVASRPPSSGLTLMFSQEEGFVFSKEQRWCLGFYNYALEFEPREESYRALLQHIPPEIRALVHYVTVAEMQSTEDDPELLVKALSQDADHLTTFECLLNETWLTALWMDKSRGWDGFCLPNLDRIFFNVYETSTAADIRTLTNLLQARSTTVQDTMHSLDVTITVPIQYDEGEIQAALNDPSLLNLGPHIERIVMD